MGFTVEDQFRTELDWNEKTWLIQPSEGTLSEQHSRPDALHSTLKVFIDGFDIHSNSFSILSEVMPSTYRNHKFT